MHNGDSMGTLGDSGLVDRAISGRKVTWQGGRARVAELATRARSASEVAWVGVCPGGLSVKASTGAGPGPAPGIPTRGKIHGFGRRSRSRVVRKIMGIDWAACPVHFVTLTFPDDVALEEWPQFKRWLKAFEKRLERAFGKGIGGFWRQEWVRRKSGAHVGKWVPHFHVCLFWNDRIPPSLDGLRRWVARAWAEVVGSTDPNHGKAGTQVLRAKNVKGPDMGKLLSYLSKYMGKIQKHTVVDFETGEVLETGRAWGFWGRVPFVEVATVAMGPEAYREFIRRIWAWGRETGSWYLSSINSGWAGYRLLGDGLLLLDRLCTGLDIRYCSRGAPLSGPDRSGVRGGRSAT